VDNKLQMYLEANIDIEEPTQERIELASASINLPTGENKQADLLYFSAVFVSSGANLNHAYFLPSEMVAAEKTIEFKGVDMEHVEDKIVGHIYDKIYVDNNHEPLDLKELAGLETAKLDEKEIHIIIAGVVYKHRFPEIAKEVDEKKWKVSMECFYNNYDIKISDTILSQQDAKLFGLELKDDVFGKNAKVIKEGKEVADGEIDRVLRNIHFAGVGFVKQPANPPSIVLETSEKVDEQNAGANKNVIIDKDNCIILEKDIDNNNVTSEGIEAIINNSDEIINEEDLNSEDSNLENKDTVGICVSYKKQVLNKDGSIKHKNWCTTYKQECTSFSADATDPDCLRNQIKATASNVISDIMSCDYNEKHKEMLIHELKAALNEAVKTLS